MLPLKLEAVKALDQAATHLKGKMDFINVDVRELLKDREPQVKEVTFTFGDNEYAANLTQRLHAGNMMGTLSGDFKLALADVITHVNDVKDFGDESEELTDFLSNALDDKDIPRFASLTWDLKHLECYRCS